MATAPFHLRRPGRCLWLPDRAAIAGVFLAVLVCVLMVYAPSGYEPEPYLRLPLVHPPRACSSLPDKGVLFVSIDAAGRRYFSTDSREVQTAAIRLAAGNRNVSFSAAHAQALATLPYLGLDVQQLPAYLSLSGSERRQIALPGLPQRQADDQLTACILAGRQANIRLLNSAPYIVLRADACTKFADIKPFMHALQKQHLHRFYAMYLDD